MKTNPFRYLNLILLVAMMAACTPLRDPSPDIPFTMRGPDGELQLNASYYPQSEDIPGRFEVISISEGKGVYSSIWFSFCADRDTRAGAVLKPERLSFGALLSSDSHEYTGSYSGRMVLKEKTKDRVVIRMEDVRFTIRHGEYVLQGDLVAYVTDD